MEGNFSPVRRVRDAVHVARLLGSGLTAGQVIRTSGLHPAQVAAVYKRLCHLRITTCQLRELAANTAADELPGALVRLLAYKKWERRTRRLLARRERKGVELMDNFSLTIRQYYHAVYLKGPLATAAKQTCHLHACMVRIFSKFDAKATVGEMSEAKMLEFDRYLRRRGHSDDNRQKLAKMLAHARPGEFRGKPRGAKPQYKADAPLVEGSIWHFFMTVYKPRRLAGRSFKNVGKIHVQIKHFANFLGREPMLTDLDDGTFASFVDWLADGRAAVTTNTARKAIFALWRYASDVGLVAKRPTVQPLPEPEQIPRAWFKHELEAIFQAARETEGFIDGIPAGEWWFALLWFLFSSGERIGAAMQIPKSDVDFERGEVLVKAEFRKGQRKPRLYRMIPPAAEALRKIADFDRPRLFPWPFLKNTLWNHYRKLVRRAGLPVDRHRMFHALRRTCASYIELASPGAATDYLQHAMRSCTTRSYLDPRICGGHNPAELLPALTIRRRRCEVA